MILAIEDGDAIAWFAGLAHESGEVLVYKDRAAICFLKIGSRNVAFLYLQAHRRDIVGRDDLPVDEFLAAEIVAFPEEMLVVRSRSNKKGAG